MKALARGISPRSRYVRTSPALQTLQITALPECLLHCPPQGILDLAPVLGSSPPRNLPRPLPGCDTAYPMSPAEGERPAPASPPRADQARRGLRLVARPKAECHRLSRGDPVRPRPLVEITPDARARITAG